MLLTKIESLSTRLQATEPKPHAVKYCRKRGDKPPGSL